MAHSHTHSHDLRGPSPLGPLAAKIVVGLLVAIGVVVLAGAALLWPSQQRVEIPLPFQNAEGGAVSTEAGHVLAAGMAECGGPDIGAVLTRYTPPAAPPDAACVHAQIAIDSGPNSGAMTLLEFSPGPGQPQLAAGEHIRITRQIDPAGTTTYSFYDYERTWPLIALAAAFAVVVVAVAGWRGLRALVGIVIAFMVLVGFMLPALRIVPVVRYSSARCGWVVTTSPVLCTRWCWPTPAVHCRCCCCSASPTGRSATCMTSETVAIEIARSAVGGIALALSVPLTTAIAAVLATPQSAVVDRPYRENHASRGQRGHRR